MVIKGYPRFKSFLGEQGIRQMEAAELLGMNRVKLNAILSGKQNSDFTATEIKTLCKEYNLDMQAVFFTDVVPYTQLKKEELNN